MSGPHGKEYEYGVSVLVLKDVDDHQEFASLTQNATPVPLEIDAEVMALACPRFTAAIG
jgi:hypothetical protein